MDFVTILFYIFSFMVAGSAVAVIASRNPVHSVLWLIVAFFNAAGLFILLGAEMLAMLLVIVYVGAVAILFLFVVMMLNIKTSSLKKGFQAHLPLGLLLGAILFLEITAVIFGSTEKIDISKDNQNKKVEVTTTETISKTEIIEDKKIVEKTVKEITKKSGKNSKKDSKKEEKIAEEKEMVEIPEMEEVPADQSPENIEKPAKATNAQVIGRVLYTEYILYFQACGLILLVAMIGAIVLTLRHRDGVRKQKTSEQNTRSNRIVLAKPESGKGVE